jgi:putative sigma-54 modulation protein
MDVSSGLREAAEHKLGKLATLLDGSGWVDVGFIEEQNPRIAEKFHCEIVAHVKGRRLKVEGSAGEPFAALDAAVDRVERQVRRLKDKRLGRRVRDRLSPSRGNSAGPELDAPDFDADALGSEFEETPAPAGSGEPAIVEVRQVDAKPMTPVEAALQAEAGGQEFVLFHNAESGRASVVYRRDDGGYGLVETSA